MNGIHKKKDKNKHNSSKLNSYIKHSCKREIIVMASKVSKPFGIK